MLDYGQKYFAAGLVTGHFYAPIGKRADRSIVIPAREAFNDDDLRGGHFCTQSGFWYPGHALVETSRGIVGVDFATEWPEDREDVDLDG